MLLAAGGADAQTIKVDEFGNSQTNGGMGSLSYTIGTDPTISSGGLQNWNVLYYNIPFLGTAGDVLVQNPFESGSPITYVLRFDGAGHLIFYSSNDDGYNSPAVTPGPPDPFVNPFFVFQHTDVLPFLIADYAPGVGNPGYDATAPTYQFWTLIPEPSAGLVLLAGLAVFGWNRCRRNASRG